MTELSAYDVDVVLGGRPVVRNASVVVRPGELAGLIGPNGAGKSTLLRALCGLLPLARGSVQLNGQETKQLGAQALARRIAYLPQRHVLHWRLSARQVVALGRLPHPGAPTVAHQRAIDGAVEHTDIKDLLDQEVDTLSGGERARVMLARALAVESDVLLADEPVAPLDPFYALQIMEMLRNLAREGMTVLIVLHDLAFAMRFCDRLLLMQNGIVTACGRPSDVLSPDHLALAYRITGVYSETEGERYVVPWRRADRLREPNN
jgi:iron complex transport system ATP-binding protein